MRSTVPASTPDYSKLIGVPYSKMDCWRIAVEFYKIVFNHDLKNYYDEIPQNRDIAKNVIYSSMGDFTKVETPKFGDLILIRLYGIESHIAVYIDKDKILHTTDHSGCCIDRLARWEKLIVGYYRVENK